MNNKAPVSAGSAKAAAAAGAAIPVEGSPRPPASVDKARIRVFLDGNFDDSRGAYLDGLDDKKAAEKLGVPWKWVTDIREAAYGPIRSNPEVDALKRDVAALRHQAEAMLAEIAKLEGRLAQIAS